MENANIHPSAVISPSAQIGNNVTIGSYSVIGDEVEIGDGQSGRRLARSAEFFNLHRLAKFRKI